MGKIRDLVKKIRDTKGTFHAKMGAIKDRNGMKLTEEDIKKTCKNIQWVKDNLLCFLILFFSQLFVRPPHTTILPFCISSSWGWS